MTVGELKQILKELRDDSLVLRPCDRWVLERASVRTASVRRARWEYSEEPFWVEDDGLPDEKALVIL